MDRIVNQISISTSLTIVRFLAKNLHFVISPIDMCILSFIIICVSYILGRNHQMSVMSRRLAVLLLVQTIQPLLTRIVGADIHVQSIMLNAGIISIVSIMPRDLPDELETIVTSIIYLYSNTLSFLVQWRREHLSILVILVTLFRLNNLYLSIHPRIQQIIAISLITTISDIIQDTDDILIDARIFRFSLFLVVLHVIASNTAHQVEDSILYSYVNFVQYTLPKEPLSTTIIAFLVSLACKQLIGTNAWPTRACILIGTNIFVHSVLDYMEHLAIYDTIVTLKTTALVLQFAMQIIAKLSFNTELNE